MCKVIVIEKIRFEIFCNGYGNLIEGLEQVIYFNWILSIEIDPIPAL